MNSEILAIIPARSGSKGLIDKNILPIDGHPLIAYSIKAALEAKYISRVIVNTDSKKIANIANYYGAEIPFIRPMNLASDDSTDYDVFRHCIENLFMTEGYKPDYIVQLRPTSPIRPSGLIDECITKIHKTKFTSLRVVTESPLTPYKMWQVEDEGELIQLIDHSEYLEPFNMPRQKLPKTYWQVGTLDIVKASTILKEKTMSGNKIMSHIIPGNISIDIDDINSFKAAEEIIKTKKYIYFEN